MAELFENPVIKAITQRRAVRSYTDEPLTDEEITVLLKCAMLAPSGRNGQHCVVRVLADKEKLDELNVDFKNKVGWDTPAYTRWDVNPVYQTAPAMFFIYADVPAPVDAGIMAENLAIAAKGLGLDSVIIGSVGGLLDGDETKWKDILRVGHELRFMLSVAIGHGAESPEIKPRKEEEFFRV